MLCTHAGTTAHPVACEGFCVFTLLSSSLAQWSKMSIYSCGVGSCDVDSCGAGSFSSISCVIYWGIWGLGLGGLPKWLFRRRFCRLFWMFGVSCENYWCFRLLHLFHQACCAVLWSEIGPLPLDVKTVVRGHQGIVCDLFSWIPSFWERGLFLLVWRTRWMFYLQNLWRTRWMFYLQNLWGVWSKVLIVVMCSSLQLNRFAHSMVRTRLRFCAFDIVNTSSLCNPNPLTHSSVFNRFLSFVLNADWERLYNNRVSVCVRRYNSMQLEHLCILSTALLFLWPLFFLCFSRCNAM